MDNNQQWYYTDRNGQQAGPVPTTELLDLIERGQASNKSMVWSEGMDNWTLASQVEGLIPSKTPVPTAISQPAAATPSSPLTASTAATTAEANPYATPRSNLGVDANPYAQPKCGGIGRLAYLGLSILLAILQQAAIFFVAAGSNSMNTSWTMLVGVMLVFLVLSFVIAGYRYKNIGHNPWWVLLLIVPIANIIIGIRCLIYQEGWVYTRKLDRAGKIAAWIIGGLFLLYVALIFVGLALG